MATELDRLKAPALALAVWVVYAMGFSLHIVLRGAADDWGPAALSLAGTESLLFHGNPTIWLQQRTPDASWIWQAAGWIHKTWFYLPIALAIVVHWRCGTATVVRLLALQLVILYTADATFTLAPTKPPWMDLEVERVVLSAYGVTASLDKNPVAALPSLHVAIPMLYCLWFARSGDARLRALTPALAVWTTAIAWAVVYGGEHYMIDVLAGALWAAISYIAYEKVMRHINAHVRPTATASMLPVESDTAKAA